jgi:hypothetical protein
MQIKNIECSVHNDYKFYEFTIDFGYYNSNNEEKEKIIKYFIMTNDKEIYYKFGLDDNDIDSFRNYNNWFDFYHNANETILNIILYN